MDINQRLIELSILQQLFYYEEDKKIPASRFKKINNYSKPRLLLYCIGLLIYITTFLYLKFPEIIEEFSIYQVPSELDSVFHIISVNIIILGTLILFSKVIRILKSITITNVELGNATIDLEDKVSKSILNHHLDEILYFFEETKNNIVILEDIDRFEQTDIFTKLREINLLINNSKKVTKDIVFIYAIRDDIFKNKDRTKFFDFIIPIIPVINSTNSSDKLLNIAKDMNLSISKRLISDISLFIDDMRLLYNILNEYQIYYKKLEDKLDQDKLFSMIVYKNIEPKDFIDLSHNTGYLYNIFIDKDSLINNVNESLNNQILEIQEKIYRIEDHFPVQIRELRLIYISKLVDEILKNSNSFYGFVKDGTVFTAANSVEDDIFNYLMSTQTLKCRMYKQNAQEYIYTNNFSKIERLVNKDYRYEEREKLIYDNLHISTFHDEISKLSQKKIENLEKGYIKDLVDEIDFSNSKSINNINLLRLLLAEGYIDENFSDYITLFHEGSLTRNDYKFLVCVKTNKPLRFDHEIFQLENIVSKLNLTDYKNQAILNMYLIDFLLETPNFNAQKEILFDVLSNETNNSIECIIDYMELTDKLESFIIQLTKQWSNIWEFVTNKSSISQEFKSKLLNLIISFAEIDDIVKIFRKKTESLTLDSNIFTILNDNIERMKEIIKRLGLEFAILDLSLSDEILEMLITGFHYKLSIDNIYMILKKEDLFNKDEFYEKNYYTLVKTGYKPLLDYIDLDINRYIEDVYLKLENNTEEPEEYFIELLNNDDLIDSNKADLIQKISTIIINISDIENITVANMLFKYNKIYANWENIINSFVRNNNQFSKAMLEFVNSYESNSIKLSKSRIKLTDEREDLEKVFCRAIIYNKDIEDGAYANLIKSIPYFYSSLSLDDITKDKIKLLIANKTLGLSSENISNLKSTYPGLDLELMEYHSDKLFKKIDTVEIDLSIADIYSILRSSKVDIDTKINIINYYDVSIFLDDEKIILDIGNLLLEENRTDIDNEIIKVILTSRNIKDDDRIRLFNMKYTIFSNLDIEDFLHSLNEPYSRIAIPGKRPLLELNDNNKTFCDILKSNFNYIIRYIPKEEQSKIKVINRGL